MFDSGQNKSSRSTLPRVVTLQHKLTHVTHLSFNRSWIMDTKIVAFGVRERAESTFTVQFVCVCL